MIRVPKSILDDPDWLGSKFSRPMAWIDLLLLADGEGMLTVSFRELGLRWKWSTVTVIRFIEKLVKENKVSMFTETFRGTFSKHLITIISDGCKDDVTLSKRSAKHLKNNTPLSSPDGFLSDSSSLSPSISPQKEKKETSVTIVPEAKKSPPDFYQSVLELWNAYAKRNVPKIKAITQPRREKIKLRIAEMGGWEKARGTLETCFRKISESDFATGATGRWAANFDWFFENEKNWLKVLEGNYDNRKEKSQLEVLAENIAKADAYYEQRYHGYGGASPYGNQAGGGPYGPDEQ